MHIEHTVEIDATADRIWAIMTDIETWPAWTGTTHAAKLHVPFATGATATMEIDGTPRSLFTVTEVTPGRSFTWETRTRGIHAAAGHRLDPAGDRPKVTLSIDFRGFPVFFFRPMLRKVAKRNIEKEAAGLKRAAEDADRIAAGGT